MLVRSRNDRVPSVKIGYQKKVLSGGASTNMLRYPTDTGTGGSWALTGVSPFQKTNWIGKAKTYTKPAMTEWGQAVDRVVRKWNVT